jgi:hypothetical protein
VRERFVGQRTGITNQIRALPAEVEQGTRTKGRRSASLRDDLLTGIKVNTDAMARTMQLV